MDPKTKRRWCQFSLKSLLVAMTLLCIGPGGYVAYEQRKAREQKAAVLAIEAAGGEVQYGDQGIPRSAIMRQILGDESFDNVWLVSFNDTPATDADLVHFSQMKNLKELWLFNTQVTDSGLAHLADLRSLTFLSLGNTQVTDVGLVHIAGLTRLEYVWLGNTLVTDDGAAKLRKALPNCLVNR
jgi:Leucine-rich repeat (LRR) protein